MSKYCVECGTKLMEKAKFCYQCGTKVFDDKEIQIISESENGNEGFKDIAEKTEVDTAVIKIEAEPFYINLFGNELELSQEYSNLKFVRNYFYDCAVKNVDKLKDYIEGNVRCCDDIYERAIPFSINCINDAYEKAVEIANELGISYLDYECMVLSIDEKYNYEAYFAYYYEMAQVVEDCAKKLASYRETQRIKTSQWRGGGFGIRGAINGHLKATALNLGTSIIREISNAITDSRDRERIQKVKEVIYRDVNMRENLYLIVYNCSFLPFYIVIQELERRGRIKLPLINEKTIEHVREVFEDYLTDNQKQLYAREALEQAIKEQPLNALFYVYLELLDPDMVEDITKAVSLLGIDYEYKIEKKGLLRQMLEEASNIGDETVLSIQKKLNILKLLKNIKFGKKTDLESFENKLNYELGRLIRLMPEYDLEELEAKLTAYKIFKKEYKGSIYNSKEYQKDIERLEIKYEDKRLLSCLDVGLIKVKQMVNKIECILKKGDYEQLWQEADEQNGYAQALLFNFYKGKVGKFEGKIYRVEDISRKLPILNEKLIKENDLAKFIYAAMKEKIDVINNLAGDRKTEEGIHIEYLHKLNKAVSANVIYAKYCMADEILFKGDAKNYSYFCLVDKSLPEISRKEVRFLIKEAANSWIPAALKQLSYLYSTKCRNYGCDIERDDKKSEKLELYSDELRILDMLQIMESNYECQKMAECETVLCKQCGNAIKIGKKFCSQCGTKVV